MNALLVTNNAQDEVILTAILRLAGLSAAVIPDLARAAEAWARKPADLLLVAVPLPTPVETVREVRRLTIVPVIVICDRIDEETHASMVEAGADWVVERPYSPRLLTVYARALLRRGGNVPRTSLPSLTHAGVRLDPVNRAVVVDGGHPQRLSQLEFRLLHTLMVHRGQVLPTETIVEHVWGYSGEGDRSLVRGLINRLRSKIEPNPNNPHLIRNVPRVGYIFGEEL